jgi:small conductance mechanosensitive channel
MQDGDSRGGAAAKLADPQTWTAIGKLATGASLNILAALAIFVAGLWLSSALSKGVVRVGEKSPRADPTLFRFLAQLTSYGVLALAAVMALGRLGVETASIVAVVGAAGLAIGLALQGTLTNLAAGVMLLIFRPFNIGEAIDGGGAAGAAGVVTGMGLFTTELVTPDHQHIVVPNSALWGNKIVNNSRYPVRGVDLRFKLAGETDISRAKEVIRQALASLPHVLKEPPPFIGVEFVRDGAVEFLVRPFCKSAHFGDVRFAAPEAVKNALDAAGIIAPVARQVVEIVKE